MKTFNSVQSEDIRFFESCVDEKGLFLDEENCKKYGRDETEDLLFPPDFVLKPKTTEELSHILAYCNERNIPVTPIGARTGLSGGALSVHGGVGLNMERFNQILDIDEDNLQATVEPGVITQVFQEAVESRGLFYPPDPASRGTCSLGGNLAENSGGPRALKYGVTRDHVLNLELVLADGTIMWTGANVLKNATGYDLTHLVVGSEGTLGVITKAVFKLMPLPAHELLLLVPFKNPESACRAVSATFKKGIIPSAMEFMERDALLLANEFCDGNIEIEEDTGAHLLIALDGQREEILWQDAELLFQVMEGFGAGEIKVASSHAEKEALWILRRKVGEAVKASSVYKEEDTVVPRFRLPDLLHAVKRIGRTHGFRSICYGHAGDGNLHINILKDNMGDVQWREGLDVAIRELFQEVKTLGGTLSGEHGIGLVQRPYMNIVFDENQMNLMKRLKMAFDPNGILNPSKIF